MKQISAERVPIPVYGFQYPQPRVYAMKLVWQCHRGRGPYLSVPSTSGLRDETVIGALLAGDFGTAFSTLDSGLRDETSRQNQRQKRSRIFQYPRLGSTR